MHQKLNEIDGPALVVDGGGSTTFVGILGSDQKWLAYERSATPPLESLFETVRHALDQSGSQFEDIRGFIYNEGPGSALGLRLCAMAVKTWSRLFPQAAHLYAFNPLQLAAAKLLADERGLKNALVVSDWRKQMWNSVCIREGLVESPTTIDEETLALWDDPIYHLPARKGWQSPPSSAVTLSDATWALPELLHAPGILKQRSQVELYDAGSNSYKKWDRTRHASETAKDSRTPLQK